MERYKLQNADTPTWIKRDREFGRYLDGYIAVEALPVSGWRANVREYPGLRMSG
jgi:hypothetical protein